MHSKAMLPALGLVLGICLLVVPVAEAAQIMTFGPITPYPLGCSLGGVGGWPPTPTIDESCVWGIFQTVWDAVTGHDSEASEESSPPGNNTGGP